ncbi:hypothetical protein GCM10017771_31330 [Streptomyces capitiformicae]|uniref:Uncharacterized protein n=1 Tax=Streptomyces capitiformicae TaxID=2014920 RepID=A0A919L7P4_9ACTN|nr:hypothetical protein GCM10017771_31330 [Streptomyces capitiformicae]
MTCEFKLAKAQWLTLTGCKRVLVVVHTEVYGQRLRDLLSLLESDLRIQVAFTMAPHAFNRGAERSLPDRLGSVIPWEEAVRTDFDLALAAGAQGTERLRAPLIRLPHGAGHMKLSRLDDDRDPGAPRTVGGLGRHYLMRNGTVVPRVLALAHREDLDVLADTCPEALPAAEVVGDAAHDRIMASLPLRSRYRRALGLRPGQKLVLVSSTWGRGSSFNRLDALLPRLLAELPRREYRIAVTVHPNVWSGHGDWQVAALVGLPPGESEQILEELLDANLIQERRPEVYRFHDLVKEYAHKLTLSEDPPGARDGAVRELIAFYLRAAEQAAALTHPRRPRTRTAEPLPEATQSLSADLSDARAARQWLLREHVALVSAERRSRAAGHPREAALLAHATTTAPSVCRPRAWRSSRARSSTPRSRRWSGSPAPPSGSPT